MPELMFHLFRGLRPGRGGGSQASRLAVHAVLLGLLVALQAPALTVLAAHMPLRRLVPAHARSLAVNPVRPRPAALTEYREVIPSPGTTGHDISYPQCTLPSVVGHDFLVVGVNHGRPFTVNDCMAQQFSGAPSGIEPSLYLNTAFDDTYTTRVDPACVAIPPALAGDAMAVDWQVGCSEAAYSVAQAGAALGAHLPSMWWLDVEYGNSWADAPLPNRLAILGVIDHLHSSGFSTGIYSVGKQWRDIVGSDWVIADPAVANWVAGADPGSPQDSCGAPFSNPRATVVMVQYILNDLDTDFVCPLPQLSLQMPAAAAPAPVVAAAAAAVPPAHVVMHQTFGALRPAYLRATRSTDPGPAAAP